MSELLVKSESLVAVADSIRAKAGSTEELVFPEGFVEAVEGISVGEEIDPIARIIGEGKLNAVSDNGSYPYAPNASMGALPTCFYLFSYCYSLTAAPLFDTSKVTDMNGMFSHCYSLTNVPLFDTSKVTSMNSMFNCCASLTAVPLFDTSNVTNMGDMFSSCYSLTNVPLFNTSKVTSMNSMFSNCSSLTAVPLFDTSKASYAYGMFSHCTSLTTVPKFDMRNVTNMSNIFSNCSSLTECWLRNIKTNLQVGAGTTYGHLLTVESLLHLIKECIDTGSIKILTIGTANMEKLANTYVKVIDITDEMRAEDDLIDEKLPFEVCESTDDGAMLITDYVLEKNWQLK